MPGGRGSEEYEASDMVGPLGFLGRASLHHELAEVSFALPHGGPNGVRFGLGSPRSTCPGLLLAAFGNTFPGHVQFLVGLRAKLAFCDGQGALCLPCTAHAAFLYRHKMRCKA